MQAKDADIGLNGAIRYELLSRGDDSHTKFYIDPSSGDIRSMVTFNLDGGKMYGFDVKATDCEGSETGGNSAMTTVYVSLKMMGKGSKTDPSFLYPGSRSA